MIDGKIAFTGGINIASHGRRSFSASGGENRASGPGAWRDTDVEIQGLRSRRFSGFSWPLG